MATLNWVQVQGIVVIAMTQFGPAGHDPQALIDHTHADLDGPTVSDDGNVERWDYGIPTHELISGDTDALIDWFRTQYPGGRGLPVQAKKYKGKKNQKFVGFVLNLTYRVRDAGTGDVRLFNFHIKIEQASMDLPTLFKSGAAGKQRQDAFHEMFPALPTIQ